MRLSLLAAGLLLTASGAAASDSGGFSMSVLVDGAPAPEYSSSGRLYLEALKGREFTIRLYNPGPGRAGVALSVDGRNVIDAKRTGALEASKWILGPGQYLDVPGWQISGATSRRFYFTETGRSYASWLGDTSNVGTIEAVFYREKRPVAARRETAKDAPEWVPEQHAEMQTDGVNGGVPEGTGQGAGDASGERAQAEVRVVPSAPSKTGDRSRSDDAGARKESDRFAATGIGQRTGFSVEWIAFEHQDRPAAAIALRYEFREQLVRLGVLPREDRGLYAREHARGFEPAYAPDPDGRR